MPIHIKISKVNLVLVTDNAGPYSLNIAGFQDIYEYIQSVLNDSDLDPSFHSCSKDATLKYNHLEGLNIHLTVKTSIVIMIQI